VSFHRYPVGSQNVILVNDDKEDVLKLRTYHFKLHEETTSLLYDAIYAPGV